MEQMLLSFVRFSINGVKFIGGYEIRSMGLDYVLRPWKFQNQVILLVECKIMNPRVDSRVQV